MLFIDPETPVNINIPNLGLAYAATCSNTKVIDQHILPYPKDRFKNIKDNTFGISVKSFTIKEAERIEKIIRKNNKDDVDIKSINGFVDVQCCYPYIKWKNSIDFSDDFSDNLQFPNYELFDSYNYLQTNWMVGLWAYPILTSLGCPYQCKFCAAKNRKWRPRSPESCFKELERAKRIYKIKKFEILDDAFNVDKNRVIEFCDKIKTLDLKWACTNGLRADKFDEDIARKMFEAGCMHVGFGMETIDDGILAKMNKGETFEIIENSVNIAKQYFKKVSGFFIIGLPGSTYEIDLNTVKWVKNKKINAYFSYFNTWEDINDNTFYGSNSFPKNIAYKTSQQIKVYNYAKKLKVSKGQIMHAIKLSIKAFFKYDINGKITHAMTSIKFVFKLFAKGELF